MLNSSYNLNEAVVTDILLRSIANRQNDMKTLDSCFNASGFASILESSEFRKKDIANSAMTRISRGNVLLFNDPQSIYLNIIRDTNPSAIAAFVDEPYSDVLAGLKDYQRKGVLTVEFVGANSTDTGLSSYVFFTPKKAQRVKNIKAQIEIYFRELTNYNATEPLIGTVTEGQIVARHRLLSLLGFLEDDVLAGVYDWFSRKNGHDKTLQLEKAYISTLYTHDLFGKEQVPPSIMCESVGFRALVPLTESTAVSNNNNTVHPKKHISTSNTIKLYPEIKNDPLGHEKASTINNRSYCNTAMILPPEKILGFKKANLSSNNILVPPKSTISTVTLGNDSELLGCEKDIPLSFGLAYIMQ